MTGKPFPAFGEVGAGVAGASTLVLTNGADVAGTDSVAAVLVGVPRPATVEAVPAVCDGDEPPHAVRTLTAAAAMTRYAVREVFMPVL